MKLVIAEKPSVAQSLAKVLGANKRGLEPSGLSLFSCDNYRSAEIRKYIKAQIVANG